MTTLETVCVLLALDDDKDRKIGMLLLSHCELYSKPRKETDLHVPTGLVVWPLQKN